MSETDSTLLDQLRQIGALKSGHFLLSSGRHAPEYLEKFDLLRDPRLTERVCRRFVDAMRDRRVDVVVGPTTGGILIAFEVARQLGVPAAYAERRSGAGAAREIRRGTTFRPGVRVLVVDDILTTGGSVRETLAALKPHEVEIVAIAVLVDRSGGVAEFDFPVVALSTLELETWAEDACPLCHRAVPLVKPGTTTLPASQRISPA